MTDHSINRIVLGIACLLYLALKVFDLWFRNTLDGLFTLQSLPIADRVQLIIFIGISIFVCFIIVRYVLLSPRKRSDSQDE